MNKKQYLTLSTGLLLIIIHLILYFHNVHAKYEKLQFERLRLKTDYSQPVLDGVRNKEDTFNKVFMAWLAVSIFLICGIGLSLWILKEKPRK